MKRTAAACLTVLMLLAGSAFAQYSGTIRGSVTDPSGAMVSGAEITVVNLANGSTRSTSTNASGEFTLPNLAPGTYDVHVKQGSFKEFVSKGVELHVSSTASVDAQLQMGNASEQVTVEANALQVQTDSAQLGEVIEGRQVLELPLNGRSMTQLMLLQPGVSAKDGFDTKDKGLLSGSDISINGNPVTNNLWLVDGANDNDLGSNRTILIYPSIDAISEFKMLRNAYGPEYGQAAGGVVSIITKSGTNQFHGSAYYFGRNDALNAENFFAKLGEQALESSSGQHFQNNGKDVLRRNDYGFSIGGPIKKDKLFFFYSEEWNKEKRGNTRHTCVPTASELGGDFSAEWDAWLSGPNGGDLTKTPVDQCGATLPAVPGTRVGGNAQGTPSAPIVTLDPAGVLVTDQLPLANTIPSAATGGSNWFQSLASSVNWRQENARIDFNLNKSNTITFRYTQDNWTNPAPNAQAYWGDDAFPAVEGSWAQPSKSIILKDTTVLSSTLTNEAQLSYSNNRIYATLGGTGVATDALGNSYSPSEYVSALEAAIPPAFPAATKKAGGMPPDAAWGGFGSYGSGQSVWLIAPWNNTSDLYNFRDDLAKVYGNHTFKTGIFIGYNKKHEPSEGGHDEPSFSFNNGNNGAGPGNSGNAIYDLLTPGSQYGFGENSANLFPTAVWHDYEFYFQDSWKIRRNLTIDYGFRWSFLRQPTEQHNNITSWSLAAYNAGNGSDPCNGLIVVPGTDPCAAAGFASIGTPGVNDALVANGNHNIAPRLGISWDPRGDGKMAVRAGIGQFYQRERVSRVTALMGQNAPFSVNFGSTRTLDVAVPAAGGSTSPNAATDPGSDIPNSWQWNFSIERELARDTSLEIGYVGNRGLHLTSDRDGNGVFPGNRLDSVFGSVERPAPTVGGIDEFGHAGSSSYHALQVLFRSRIGNHSQIQAAYTWSHSIANVDLSDSSGSGFGTHTQTDPYNINADAGNSQINRPQMFVANAVYYLPAFSGTNPALRQVIGGWELATIFQALSGNSLTEFYNGTVTDSFTGNNISDNYGTGNGSGNINAQRFMTTGISCNAGQDGFQIFNPDAFTLVGYRFGTIGNEPRGYCHGPRQVNLDLSVYKTWKVGEKLSIQFRLETYNFLNHTQFLSGSISGGLPTTVACGTAACSPTNSLVTSQSGSVASNFGQSTSTRPAREIQYALKFVF